MTAYLKRGTMHKTSEVDLSPGPGTGRVSIVQRECATTAGNLKRNDLLSRLYDRGRWIS